MGKVVSGRGLGSDRIANLSELFSTCDLELYPGTLNVVLKKPVGFLKTTACYNYNNRFYFWKAKLNGFSCFVYRWPQCPLHVLEIVASHRLRDLLASKEVEIEVSENFLRKLSYTERLVWSLSWEGRREQYYKDSLYIKMMGKMENGAYRIKGFFGLNKAND
jgi:hypothetical protein